MRRGGGEDETRDGFTDAVIIGKVEAGARRQTREPLPMMYFHWCCFFHSNTKQIEPLRPMEWTVQLGCYLARVHRGQGSSLGWAIEDGGANS